MLKKALRTLSLFYVIFLSGCAANQISAPAQSVATENTGVILILKEGVTVKASRTKNTVLKAGTTWITVGNIEQGTILKTKDQVVIVNSFDVHEAQIVVNNALVVGYYLPYAKTFVESKPVAIHLVEKGVPR